MSVQLSSTQDTLKKLNIRHFDELIHDQSKEWLIENFKKGASDYPINVTVLIRNIIWQLRERIQSQEKPPLKELIRTFWYMYIKPTLARVDSLSQKTDQYDHLVSILADLVKKFQVMEYEDIGFRDDNAANRQTGLNANVILYAEKVGHVDYLKEMADKYHVSIIAFGGQPSVMNIEYFVEDLKSKGVDLRRSFFLFGIVDFDTSGWIIRDALIDDLNRFGISNIKNTNLIHPDMLTPEEIQMSRFPIPDNETTKKKNASWLKEIKKQGYTNTNLLLSSENALKRVIFGLESESVSTERISKVLDELLPPLLGKDERLLKILALEEINQKIKDLIVIKMT